MLPSPRVFKPGDDEDTLSITKNDSEATKNKTHINKHLRGVENTHYQWVRDILFSFFENFNYTTSSGLSGIFFFGGRVDQRQFHRPL